MSEYAGFSKESCPQTFAAIENFGKGQLPRKLIKSLAEVKLAAFSAAQETDNRLDQSVFQETVQTLNDIIEGKHDELFPLPLKQGGAGTSIHMNINEVAAYLSQNEIDALEDINRYQSTNDVFTTAVTIMSLRDLTELEEEIICLQELLVKSEDNYSDILITGRTQLQEALPITLGQVFGSWAGAVQRDRWRLHKLKERLRTTALGGTALGTCFSAPGEYIFTAERNLRELTGLNLCRSQNLPDEISHLDKYSELASGYRLAAENIIKITGDLLLYTSSLSGEMLHPEVQYGSTIMAAKTNPVLLEVVRGLCLSVQGEAQKVSLYTQNGQLQLNPYLPFLTESLIQIQTDLLRALRILNQQLLPYLKISRERIKENLIRSNAVINALLPLTGYRKLKDLKEIIKRENPSDLKALSDLISRETELDSQTVYNQISRVTFTL